MNCGMIAPGNHRYFGFAARRTTSTALGSLTILSSYLVDVDRCEWGVESAAPYKCAD